MIDTSNIFKVENTVRTTDIEELLLALIDPKNTIEDKREVWRQWQNHYYNMDDIVGFFDGSLFNRDGGQDYTEIMCKSSDWHSFYELAMSLDMANIDPKAYYLYWILRYNEDMRPWDSAILKEAFEYDPETILSIFPNIKEILFQS